METLTIILNSAPYGDEKVWNALRLAKALISDAIKMKVNIFFMGECCKYSKKRTKNSRRLLQPRKNVNRTN